MSVTILNEKETASLIGSIGRRGKSLDSAIWQAGASALSHAAESGNFGLFDRLVNALPKGARVSTLINWAESFSPLSCNKQPGGLYKSTKKRGPEVPEWDLESIQTFPWWEHKKAQETTVVDINAIAEYLRKIEEGRDTPTRKIAQDARDGASYLRAALAAMTTKTISVEKAPLSKVA